MTIKVVFMEGKLTFKQKSLEEGVVRSVGFGWKARTYETWLLTLPIDDSDPIGKQRVYAV